MNLELSHYSDNILSKFSPSSIVYTAVNTLLIQEKSSKKTLFKQIPYLNYWKFPKCFIFQNAYQTMSIKFVLQAGNC